MHSLYNVRYEIVQIMEKNKCNQIAIDSFKKDNNK